MKSLFILICFLSSIVITWAQNWSPINHKNIYNYGLEGNGSITHTVIVDSAKQKGTDSIYYLNPTLFFDNYLSYALEFLDNPIADSILNKNNGSYLFYKNDKKYFIDLKQPINTSWLMDTLNNIRASVTGKYEGYTFGVYDSIIRISQDHISYEYLFSKTFGFLNFKDLSKEESYNLLGIQNLNLGKNQLVFEDIFSFSIGDVFCYRNTISYGGDVYPSGYYSDIKIEIIGKSYDSTLKIYSYDVIQKVIEYTVTEYWTHQVTWYGEKSTDTLTKSIYFQDYNTDINIGVFNQGNTLDSNYNYFCNSIYSENNFYDFSNCIMVDDCTSDKMISPYYSSYPYTTLYNEIKDFDPLNQKIQYLSNYNSNNEFSVCYVPHYIIFEKNIGIKYWGIQDIFGTTNMELLGYIKNGDTTGVIFSDSHLLSAEDLVKTSSKVNFYPNPLKDNKLFIKGSIENLDVKIFDLSGRVVFEERNINSEIEIPENINSGIYFIELSNNIILSREKLIIER